MAYDIFIMMTQGLGELVYWSSVAFDRKSCFPYADLGMSPEVRILSANGHKRTLDSGLVLSVRPEEPVTAVGGRFHQLSGFMKETRTA